MVCFLMGTATPLVTTENMTPDVRAGQYGLFMRILLDLIDTADKLDIVIQNVL